MIEKILTVYSKTTGCHQCNLTKRKLADLGVIDRVKIIYIDQPENADVLENLKAHGLTTAPIVMASYPVTFNGETVTEWTGFIPAALEAAAQEIGAK